MPVISDLEPYSTGSEGRRLVAIGWLGRTTAFETGSTPPSLIEQLRKLARKPVNLTRGWQQCPFCDFGREAPPYIRDDAGTVYQGNGEIRVDGGDRVFVAPTLIVHYIGEHEYVPPVAFIDAVLAAGS